MAAPTFAALTGPLGSWRGGGPNNKKFLYFKGVLTVDGSVGAAVGDIPFSVFGFINSIQGCTNLVISTDDHIEVAHPDHLGTSLLTKTENADTLTDLPAGAYTLTIWGI